MIIEMTRGHIRLKVDSKITTIQGEMLFPDRGSDSPNFVIYGDSIKRWDPPFDSELIDDKAKQEILRLLHAEMAKKGLKIEVE